MTYENFVYWLRGFLEVAKPNALNKEQIDIIESHLDLCLSNVTSIKKTYKPFEIPIQLYQDDNKLNCNIVELNGGSC